MATVHIATVHWRNDTWINLQMSMFQQHIHVPYKVYGYLTDIDVRFHHHFHRILSNNDPEHAEKLNLLASAIIAEAAEDDWIVFIDGDAFPIDDLIDRIAPLLKRAPLVAIQRLENLGEKHAHPSFCVTTVGFWKELNSGWDKGHHWINAFNAEETDVGAELLRTLLFRNIPWIPLHRTNSKNLLPVWYGIYGDVIYHHGAGFRSRGCRRVWYDAGLYHLYRRIDVRILNNIVPAKYQKVMRDSLVHPEGRLKSKIEKHLAETDRHVLESILHDSQFIQSLR